MQALQIGDESLQVVRFQIRARHLDSRLDRLRIGDPAGEIAACVRQHRAADHPAAAEMRQIGSDVARGPVPSNRVALRAAGGQKDLLAALRRRRFRLERLCRLRGQPGVELVRGQGDHFKRHVGVLRAAVLAALAAIDARLVGLDPEDVLDAGNHVAFAVQSRHPKAVNDIGARQLQPHRLAGGDVDFVGGDNAALRIANFPPPHVADHADRQRVRRASAAWPTS